MSRNRLSDEVLFETKVHCLYLLNQFNKPDSKESRSRKHQMNESYKLEIVNADNIDDIKTILKTFKEEIKTKREGLLFRKVEECLDIPVIKSLESDANDVIRVIPRDLDPLLVYKLNACIPLLAYSLAHPEHPIKDLISRIRTADDLNSFSSLITEFKDSHVKSRSIFSSIFSRDGLSHTLDKSLEIVHEFTESNPQLSKL